jgi:hypothetical protein
VHADAFDVDNPQMTAEPDQLLVTWTVKDLAIGSGLRFQELGTRMLKGVSSAERCTA